MVVLAAVVAVLVSFGVSLLCSTVLGSVEKLKQEVMYTINSTTKKRSMLVREEKKRDCLQPNPSCYCLTETMKNGPKLNTLSRPDLHVVSELTVIPLCTNLTYQAVA